MSDDGFEREDQSTVFSDPSCWKRYPGNQERWACLLCSTKPMKILEAKRHQAGSLHVKNTRSIDIERRRSLLRPQTPPSRDPEVSRTPYTNKNSRPAVASFTITNTPPFDRLSPGVLGSKPSSYLSSVVSSPLASISDSLAIASSSYLFARPASPQSSDAGDFEPLRGPRLEDDPVTAVYDDFQALEDAMSLSSGDDGVEDSDPAYAEMSSLRESTDDFVLHSNSNPTTTASSVGPETLISSLLSTRSSLADTVAWAPWRNQKECIFSILEGLPRTVWSREHFKVLDFILACLGTTDYAGSSGPSPKVKKTIESIAGSLPKSIQGSMGNIHTVNSLTRLLSNEMSNPLVRSQMSFYPIFSDDAMDDPKNASTWFSVNPQVGGPMVRLNIEGSHNDFYVFEPCLVRFPSSEMPHPVIPMRWFVKDDALHGTCRKLLLTESGHYCVAKEEYCLKDNSFTHNYPKFLLTHECYGLPSPDEVPWEQSANGSLKKWEEQPQNRWRSRANGRQVLSVPIMLYCDDTSGNVSKKWNKLNSWLCSPVGLPPSLSKLQYNTLFLATSDKAAPLEMLEEIHQTICDGTNNGIAAYDCLSHEEVLLIPWVFALQGDNPMQSEMASHIGMQGTFFCRRCKVRGKDAAGRGTGSDAEVARRIEFMKVSELRSADETRGITQTQLQLALNMQFSQVDKLSTSSGIKDRHLNHFIDILRQKSDAMTQSGSSTTTIQQSLKNIRDLWEDNLTNPAFTLPEFDPHKSTPVEILHVFLLGLVKYLWRDAVSRLNNTERMILKTRLSSLDVKGLGLSPLSGHTLVQYAGSLTGRDFRAIVQVGPAVLYQLLPPPLYEMWVALGRLAPLVYQPVIHGLDSYIILLRNSITDFLKATALWNVTWFNKPKFHVLLHLPDDIQRFGPAIFCATEGFESFNAVIRARSVHSNRAAPSRDIAIAFSTMHAIRHLLSGGLYSLDSETVPLSQRQWEQAGPAVLALAEDPTLQNLVGMTEMHRAYHYKHRKDRPSQLRYEKNVINWVETMTCRFLSWHPTTEATRSVRKTLSFVLGTGDQIQPGCFVIIHLDASDILPTAGRIKIGRVREILAHDTKGSLVGVLLQVYSVGEYVLPYRLPRLVETSEYSFVGDSSIVGAVHCIHNCVESHCVISTTREVRRERTIDITLADEFRHNEQPNNLLLNLSYMKHSWLLQQFQPPLPRVEMSVDDAAQEGVRFLREQAEAEAAAKKARQQELDRRNTSSLAQEQADWCPKVLGLAVGASIDMKLSQLKVPHLKTILKTAQLGVGGSKNKLMNRLKGSDIALQVFEEVLGRFGAAAQNNGPQGLTPDIQSGSESDCSVEHMQE